MGGLSDNDRLAKAEIKKGEGFVPSADGLGVIGYYDNNGWLTRGYGHLVLGAKRDPSRAGEHAPELFDSWSSADALFDEDYLAHKRAATQVPGWSKASPVQQRGLVNLTFNMGPDWWKAHTNEWGEEKHGWPGFTAAAEAGDWNKAADELEDSKWFREDVGSRGPAVVSLVRPASGLTEEKSVVSAVAHGYPTNPGVMGQVGGKLDR
jgi:GH24 family phage-related lysozyme (muramidase)